MNGKSAAILFAGICILLAVLLLAEIIKITFAAAVFAVALVVLGILSKNFRKQ